MFGMDAGASWLAAALLLGIAELVIPGVFLIFLAIAAAITGAVTIAAPVLPIPAQFVSFAIWSAIIVLIGRRWYGNRDAPSADPLLNDRAARLVGTMVTVTEPIKGGSGRVAVGDGAWPATGPDLEAGAKARIVAVSSGIVEVEPLG